MKETMEDDDVKAKDEVEDDPQLGDDPLNDEAAQKFAECGGSEEV